MKNIKNEEDLWKFSIKIWAIIGFGSFIGALKFKDIYLLIFCIIAFFISIASFFLKLEVSHKCA